MPASNTSLRWCNVCNVPLLSEKCDTCKGSGFSLKVRKPADLRPVFEEERKLILETLDKQYEKGAGRKILYDNHLIFANKIFYIDQAYEIISDGKIIGHFFFDVYDYNWSFKPMEHGSFRIFKNLNLGVFMENSKVGDEFKINESNFSLKMKYLPIYNKYGVFGVAQILNERRVKIIKTFLPISREEETKPSSLKDVLDANLEYVRKKESKAVAFIHKISSRIKKPVCVSYSGGKDSLTTLILVLKAGLKPKVSFTNTGIELPETIENVNKVAKKFGLELLISNANESFWKGLDVFGLPSRDYRWCCKIVKLIPTARLYKKEFPEGSLTFVGQRALESRSRARTGSVWKNYWIPKSISASPINDWDMLTVWIYLLYEDAFNLVNKAYFYGFDRIGCYLCPSCSIGDYLYLKNIHPNIWRKFEERLMEKFLSEESPFIKYHLWRWKKVPNKIKSIAGDVSRNYKAYTVKRSEETTEIIVNKKIDKETLEEFFKILEDFEKPDILLKHENKIILNLKNKDEKSIISVILRAAYCQECRSCEIWCPSEAISFNQEGRIHIDETKCKKCKVCTEKCPIVEFLL
ncbi:MAG: phosphoadenosine phosphosulfate reductase family protein [Thermoproteota archaeon]